MTKFLLPDISDKRIVYAGEYLENKGFSRVYNLDNADFVLLGMNPKDFMQYTEIPVYAGNVRSNNVFDYTKNEAFALENAYLTAEGALALAVSNSPVSLVNANVLIVGYGRIGKALHKYLNAFTSEITVCARDINARTLASCNHADVIHFSELKNKNNYDFIFNTVPHPIINEAELRCMKREATLLDLASFPGGVDKHFAQKLDVHFIIARGLPAKFSPETAGIVVGKAVENMILRKE